MFKKLRNHLILINCGITSIVILVAFTIIYVSFTKSAANRPPAIQSITFSQDENVERIIIDSLSHEKQEAARSLLITLIISGILIELIVILVSYYMAEEAIKPIHEAYDAQKVFVANASHEIKTPLAAIQANLEAADIHENKWINNAEKEVTKLAELNNELLTMARTDLVTKSAAVEVNLTKITSSAINSFRPRMSNKKLKVSLHAIGKIKIAKEDYLQILSILIDNAIKYSDQRINISLTAHKLEISNDGAKISADDLPRIFDRFYQTDKSAEGVGLGLSIAKAIAGRNKWELTAESSRKYTKFALKF